MRQLNRLLTCAVLALTGCATPEDPLEPEKSRASNLESARFNPSEPAPQQQDDWSCSVHTATWMLRATGSRETLSSVMNHMLARKQVTQASGLSDASGAGLADTLRELAKDGPSIGSTGDATFEEVAARAGRMAVGIGGRAWNHWSGVRGYDAHRDVLLLANSATSWQHVGDEMDRGEFARLGAMSMVWMDYGGGASQSPPTPSAEPSRPASSPASSPFVPTRRPPSEPFPPLEVRSSVRLAVFITQCSVEADAQRVWRTDGGGPKPSVSWATSMYPEEAKNDCGAAGPDGVHPLVFRSLSAGALEDAWIVECSGHGDGAQHVFHVDAEVDGHPAASFLYNEPNPDCD